VIVLKKLSHGFYFVFPTTTQVREGSWFVPFRQQGKDMIACLHQARAIDFRRLSSRLGKGDSDDFERVKDGYYIMLLFSAQQAADSVIRF